MLAEFESRYAPARKSLRTWVQIVEAAQWSSFVEVKSTFTSADYVAPYVVFNVGGNKYRIITLIKFSLKLVQVEFAMTHEQYNRWEA